MPAHEEPSPPESTETLLSPFVPLMDAATDGLYILDADARLVLASRSFARMLGYAPRTFSVSLFRGGMPASTPTNSPENSRRSSPSLPANPSSSSRSTGKRTDPSSP